MTFPILDQITELKPPIKLYALNGAAMAFANEIEETMFWCYLAASDLTWEQAVDRFYAFVRFANKQDQTDTAVSAKVEGTEHAERWSDLVRRIRTHLGEGTSLRNLIGHNPITMSVYALTLDDARARYRFVPELRQKRAMVERRSRPHMIATETEMLTYCEALFSL